LFPVSQYTQSVVEEATHTVTVRT